VGSGAFISQRAGFNPGELVDFILGWAGIDIFNDDGVSKTEAPR
jgi:hypothetical protein